MKTCNKYPTPMKIFDSIIGERVSYTIPNVIFHLNVIPTILFLFYFQYFPLTPFNSGSVSGCSKDSYSYIKSRF